MDSNFLSEGPMVERFEEAFGKAVGGSAAAVTNGGAGLLALLEYVGVRGHEVIVPTNTFMATALAVVRAGGRVVFADCNREDLCLSAADLASRVTPRTRAVLVVHIGGHIAFDILEIVEICRTRGLALIEDCAHAHGASYHGVCAGLFGVGGAYSFYATKTLPLGEGGAVVSRDPAVIEWVRTYRNYGKPTYQVSGFNFRMNEFTAALGLVQLARLPEILRWKRELAAKYDQIFSRRVRLPAGMESGFYKYIVFDTLLSEQTGKVFDTLCHDIMGQPGEFLGAAWVRDHHACAPIYFGWGKARLGPEGLRAALTPGVGTA